MDAVVDVALGDVQRGAVGLVAALWSGVWWMSNVREAVSAQWALPAPNPAALQRLLYDLVALVGLGAALLATPAAEQIGETVRLFDPVAYGGSLILIVAACAAAALGRTEALAVPPQYERGWNALGPMAKEDAIARPMRRLE